MLIPTLLPDEWIFGNMGRIGYQNLLPADEVELARKFGLRMSKHSNWFARRLGDLLARLHGVDVSFLIRQHSTVPAERAVEYFPLHLGVVQQFNDAWHVREAFTPNSSPAKICWRCVEEDLKFWGISYLRRSHQLHGVLRCSKHQEPLLMNEHRYSHLELSPREALKSATVCLEEKYDESDAYGVVRRYEAVMGLFLENTARPLHSAIVGCRIRTKANEQQIWFSPDRSSHNLGSFAEKSLPRAWLRQHFPILEFDKEWLDRVVHPSTSSPPASVFALAIALLWDNPEEAILEMMSAEQVEDSTHECSRNAHFLDMSGVALGELAKSWLAARGNLRKVAKRWGMSECQALHVCSRNGLPGMTSEEYDAAQFALSNFFKGTSLRAACEMTLVDCTKAETVLRALGQVDSERNCLDGESSLRDHMHSREW